MKRDSGNVVVSRFPILQSWEIYPGSRLTGVLVDLRPQFDSDLLVIANHWSCCSADANRQDQADAFVEFLRDAKTPGGTITLTDGTPMVAAGDFNLVGLAQQLTTLLTGDIQDEGQFGPDAAPDWNNLPLVFPPTRHLEARVGWTWRNDGSSFYPGVLDWIFYGASDLTLGNHFILDSRMLSPTTLSALGMSSGDSPLASDHSPRVADFRVKVSTAAPPVVRPAERCRRVAAPERAQPVQPAHGDRIRGSRHDLRASLGIRCARPQGPIVRSAPMDPGHPPPDLGRPHRPGSTPGLGGIPGAPAGRGSASRGAIHRAGSLSTVARSARATSRLRTAGPHLSPPAGMTTLESPPVR